MTKIIFISIPIDDLQSLIIDSVNSCLEHHNLSSDYQFKEDNEILNVRQAGEFLGLAIPTIYSLTSKRLLPHSKRGKKLYFNKSELIEWIKSGKRKTVSDFKLEASKR